MPFLGVCFILSEQVARFCCQIWQHYRYIYRHVNKHMHVRHKTLCKQLIIKRNFLFRLRSFVISNMHQTQYVLQDWGSFIESWTKQYSSAGLVMWSALRVLTLSRFHRFVRLHSPLTPAGPQKLALNPFGICWSVSWEGLWGEWDTGPAFCWFFDTLWQALMVGASGGLWIFIRAFQPVVRPRQTSCQELGEVLTEWILF